MTTAIANAWPRRVPVVDNQMMLPPAGTWEVYWDWYEGEIALLYRPHNQSRDEFESA